jgi:eukaryotic-like serine/threonine-protein kinase
MEDNERAGVTIRFGVFEVDPRSGELRKAGVRIRVQDQPFKVLLALLERPGELVSREELKARIWPQESFGDFDHAVNVAVGKLRTALGDSAETPRYVETLHRRGYRFVFPVEPESEEKSAGAEESAKAGASGTTKGVGHGKGRNWGAAGLLAIVAMGLAGLLVYGRRPRLTDKSRIVLGDFANTTGDTVFDGALRQGLEVQLEQSPFLSLLSRNEIEQTLLMMKQPSDAKLTPVVAKEICERTQSAAVLDAAIAQIGTRYSLIVKAENCANGETLASTEAEASDKNHVLEALGKASSEIRRKLGESLASVKKYDTPLEQATTNSLEALKAFDLGYQAGEKGDYSRAIPFFERAVSLDPKFAMAYTLLGMMDGNLHDRSRALENLRKGYDLRAAVSGRERFYIEFEYYAAADDAEGENSRRVIEVWMQTYPRDCTARTEAGALYAGLEQLEKSLAYFQEAHQLCPEDRLGAAELVQGYIKLDRFAEARAALDEATAKGLDSFELRRARYRLDFLQNDRAGMAEQVRYAMGKAGLEDDLLNEEASTAAYFGRLKEARELARRAIDSAGRSKEDDDAVAFANDGAMIEAMFGNQEEARKQITAAMKLPGAEVEAYWTGLACAMAGDETRATQLYERVLKPPGGNDPVLRETMGPVFSALLAMNRKEYAKAAEMVHGTEHYDMRFDFYLAYFRGLVFLSANNGSQAEADFQKVLEHRGMVWNSPTGALAHLQIGRAYAMEGETGKARAAYEEFLTLWKDADGEIPILKQAKAEYAELR